jgi:hypothetical protein
MRVSRMGASLIFRRLPTAADFPETGRGAIAAPKPRATHYEAEDPVRILP